jgi:NTE family protein
LQGGGSHSAFTCGVFDRLLDEETIEIIGVTGTSAEVMIAQSGFRSIDPQSAGV